MPLTTRALVTINATTVAVAHGLTHAGASRTPHVVHIMPDVGTAVLASFGYAVTFDSVTVTIQRGIATDHAAQMYCQRAHTITDPAGTF